MLRVNVNLTLTTFRKCLNGISQSGGMLARSVSRQNKSSYCVVRKYNLNLSNQSHVRDARLTKSSNLNHNAIEEMPKTKEKFLPTGNVWTYHDILAYLAKNKNLEKLENFQFLEIQKTAPSSTKSNSKTKRNTISACLDVKPFSVQTRVQAVQYTTCSTFSRKSNIKENIQQTLKDADNNENDDFTYIREEEKLLKIFPQPKYSLNHVFITLANHFGDNSYQVSPRYRYLKHKGSKMWECTYSLKWPQSCNFTSIGITKQDAAGKACLEALKFLYSNKHITNKNLPIIPGQEEAAKAEYHRKEPLILKDEVLYAMQGIVEDYREKMLQHLETDIMSSAHGSENGADILETTEEVWPISNSQRMSRFQGVEFYKCKEGKTLPITSYKEQIIETIKSARVVIIKGEPGCGKSIRVPQYILEGWAKDFQPGDSNCRIIVTQPRRIAAISLAERVASERAELTGGTVGYQVRLKSNFSRNTGKILYCTTGILLRRLQTDPALTDCTHVVLDEAHERDVNTDLLLNLLKGALQKNANLKLLVMSATIKAEVFQEYFAQPHYDAIDENSNNTLFSAEVVHVPGFTFPVTTHFLDGKEIRKLNLEATRHMCMSDAPTVVAPELVNLLKYIHNNRPVGAILVFLPGWEDIVRVKNLLPGNDNIQVLCLHSRMPDSEQRMIFHKFPPGVRKIILATNIAETSVTIDDVGYVVDCGIQKEKRFDVEKGIAIIDNHWISKASSIQRKGRAGRVQAGEAFMLYPESTYKKFGNYSLPEIQRTSLTKIVLDSKVYSNNMKASDFLGQLITPPEETAIDCAVDELVELELLDEAENLTPLGRVISDFQLEPKLAKALVNSVIYKCVTPIVDIVTYFSADMEVFGGGLSQREKVNRLKQGYSSSSDHLSMMRMFEQWLEYAEKNNNSTYEVESFCRQNNIMDHKMRTLQQLRSIHFDYLHKGLHDCLPLSDDYSDNDELVKAVMLSGVGTVLRHHDHDLVKGKLKKKHTLLTRHNQRATISSDSVNQKRNQYPTNYLLYINETRSNIRKMTVIRETSLVPPLTVLLFKKQEIIIEPVVSDKGVSNDGYVVVRLDGTHVSFLTVKEHAVLLIKCKESINAFVDYYIYQLTKGAEYDKEVNQIWDGILHKLSSCLRAEASGIAF